MLRPAITLPVELYTLGRERKFGDAEAELAGWLAREPALVRPAARKAKIRERKP